jgi:hypothetical protein
MIKKSKDLILSKRTCLEFISIDNNEQLELAANEQAKFSKSGTLTAGYYRVSGYVKFTNTSKMSEYTFNIWSRGTGSNVVVGGAMNNLVVGNANENGWYYFECDFEHKENYTLMQFVISSFSSSTIYFDDIVYAKYIGTGTPAATQLA